MLGLLETGSGFWSSIIWAIKRDGVKNNIPAVRLSMRSPGCRYPAPRSGRNSPGGQGYILN